MKHTVNILNEGFSRKYMKEDLYDSLKNEIRRKLKAAGYNVDVEGAEDVIEAAAEYIEMSRDYLPNEDYSVEEWIRGTEENYPEELAFMKESLNETTELNLGPVGFKSDLVTSTVDKVGDVANNVISNADEVANAASTVLPLLADDDSEKEFMNSLEECLSKLNEAGMSDEDKRDSEILRRIYDKTQQRANAALTPEEKQVLAKYGLKRSQWNKNIDVPFGDRGQTTNLVNNNEKPGKQISRYDRYAKDSDKINYADRARKIKDRGYGYERSLPYRWDGPSSDDHREYKGPDGKWVRMKGKGLLDRERDAENVSMTDKVNAMKTNLYDRKYHGARVASNNAEYDAKKIALQREYEKKLADLERSRETSGKYHQDSLDRANKNIDNLLKREDVSEDFNECNLNKMGTNEYEANANRDKHIKMYRKFANLTEDEEITEDNINQWALDRTATFANREPERIKSEILGTRYSNYEV